MIIYTGWLRSTMTESHLKICTHFVFSVRAEVRCPQLHPALKREDLDRVAILGTIPLSDRIHIIFIWKEVKHNIPVILSRALKEGY